MNNQPFSHGILDLDDFDPDKKRMRRMPLPAPAYDPARAKAAMDAAFAAIEAQARRTAFFSVKMQARRYALRPAFLDMIEENLSHQVPRVMIASLKARLAAEIRTPRRYMGFGGEVPLINIRAAIIYARFLRAKDNQILKPGRVERGRTARTP